ncbi:hypothetical protein BT69DRAFT_1098868 [Atractiella rhizophila]|nr:hypothetical protein BT69DRAFT_1098868 [Atractiella rhizophila]
MLRCGVLLPSIRRPLSFASAFPTARDCHSLFFFPHFPVPSLKRVKLKVTNAIPFEWDSFLIPTCPNHRPFPTSSASFVHRRLILFVHHDLLFDLLFEVGRPTSIKANSSSPSPIFTKVWIPPR